MVLVIKSKIIFEKSVAIFAYQLMLKIIFALLHRKRIHKKINVPVNIYVYEKKMAKPLVYKR